LILNISEPNPAHKALADAQKKLKSVGRHLRVITQNIDGLHTRAGSENIIELHGNLFKTRCTQCKRVQVNTDSPICKALRDLGSPDTETTPVPIADLPHCECGGLLRPHVVWFGECLDLDILAETGKELSSCDLCLLVGTSSVVYPAAGFAPELAARGVPVAEFNMEETDATSLLDFHFSGPAGKLLPDALRDCLLTS